MTNKGNLQKKNKIKRHERQSEKISRNAKKEAKEGKTYETGIGLNLQKESTIPCSITVDIDKITMGITADKYKEFAHLVSPFVERPIKKAISYL